ncbi:MAG: methionyl-tRNA formyltransferase, partial [Clostridia bacterium]|nr:methionyl-tRNA formyltransferase [Clostridia bacterium]
MKIVFMGTPDFSVPCLAALVENGYDVVLVITQADKPKGRGHKLTPPPVKEYAMSQGIPVFQPEKMKDISTY